MKKNLTFALLLLLSITLISCLTTSSSIASPTAVGGGRHVLRYPDGSLGLAIKNGDNQEVKSLLDNGVSPNQKQAGIPPLAVAIQANNLEAMEMIINHRNFSGINDFYTVSLGGSVPNTESYTAIVDAILVGNPQMIKILLDKGAAVDYVYEGISHSRPAYMNFQQTPLQLACSLFGDYDVDRKKDVSRFNVEEQLIQLQRIADKTKNVNRILTLHNAPNGVGPGNKPYSGGQIVSRPVSLFMYITKNSHYKKGNPYNEMINKVLFSIADRVNLNYKYPTFSPQFISQLKAAGVDSATIKAAQEAQAYAYESNTAVHNNAPLLDYMLNNGGSVSMNKDGGKFFFVNIYDTETLHVMLKHGMDINAPAYNGFRLVYGAVKHDPEFLEEVLKSGANPNLALKDGSTAIDFAGGLPLAQRAKAISILKKYGAK